MRQAEQRFEAMVRALSADLYRYAFWLCRNRALAEDLVQETFLRAWRFLDGLRDEKKAKAWLITTLRREHARHYARVQPDLIDLDLDRLDAGATSAEQSAEVDILRRAIAELPEKYREPLVLQVLGGYSGDEIGEMLGIPRATVMTHLFRARQRLREVLDPGHTADSVNGNAR